MFWLVWICIVVSCANPIAAIQPEINTFKKKFPNNFGFVDSGNRKVHFAWAGDKSRRPLIFVHGSPGSWEGWAHFLLNENLQSRFFIIAVDRLGYGESGKGLTETSLEKQAQAIIDVFKISSKTPILIGHSFGGPVIAKAAMLDANKVAGLIFVASSVSPELERIKWFQYLASWWPFNHLIPSNLRVCNEEIFPLKNELTAMALDWKQIKSKVSIIQGMDDLLVPPGNADFLVTHLSRDSIVSIEKIPDQGHFIPWERSDLILKAIDKVEAAISN